MLVVLEIQTLNLQRSTTQKVTYTLLLLSLLTDSFQWLPKIHHSSFTKSSSIVKDPTPLQNGTIPKKTPISKCSKKPIEASPTSHSRTRRKIGNINTPFNPIIQILIFTFCLLLIGCFQH